MSSIARRPRRPTIASFLYRAAALAFALLANADTVVTAQDRLELKRGDHIAIVGGSLAERMQHDGWLETLIHARFPQHELVFRNLGYPGDEIDGWRNFNSRLRSRDFGSHDQWLSGSAPCPQPNNLSPRDQGKVRENRFELTETRADVIFAFYGYNESWAGEAGLARFKQNVADFIKHTLAQKYNGRSAPRLVMFSPIAHELIDDPNLPTRSDVDASNARLKMYSLAMGEVAKTNGVLFVDLFTPTSSGAKAANGRNLTLNGIHLDEGNLLIAQIIQNVLFGGLPPSANLDKLRAAVNDKNFYWFHRYRVTDGYSTYGDRAFLKFSEGPGGYGNGLSNYSVAQRELEVLDLLTSNRDKVVWAAAQVRELKADDSNLPEFIPVITNKPGPLPGGKHRFLGGEEAIGKMSVAKNMKVTLFASEEDFKELVNPVQMAFDTQGRLWVAAWRTYPHWKPTEPMDDKLLILEDTNGDGRADQCKTFAGDLHNPTGFEFWNGGVIVAQGPRILFLKDTNGDDKADIREQILSGTDTADTHHTANSFILDPGGALYFQEGTFHHSQIETPWGRPRRVANGAVFRYEPRSQKIDVYVSHGFANPHGHAFDEWGQDIVADGTGANPYHAALFSGHVEYPQKHPTPPQVYQQRTRPLPAIEYLSSQHFPPEMQGDLLVENVIGFLGILRYKIENKGASFAGTELEPLLSSTDANFRPVDIEIGPDGAIWFTDWQNPIIGHMQHNLRDPSRDQTHGRVYRLTYEGRPLNKPVAVAGEPIDKLLDLLKHPEARVRYRARIELSARKSDDVLAAADRWLSALDKKHNDYERHVLEALWVFQQHNRVNADLLQRVLASPDFRARAAATRVLCYWRDRVPAALDLLRRLAADEHPRVRLEAVRAASFFTTPEAMEVVVIAGAQPSDPYIDFVRGETMKTLEPIWRKALGEGRPISMATDAGGRYLLANISTERLLTMDRSRAVFLEMLHRPGLQDERRREAVQGLARLDNKPELRVIIDAIQALDAKDGDVEPSVVFDIVRQLTGRSAAELTSARAELEKLATSARQPMFRQIGYVALINVDRSVEPAWKLANRSVASLRDFLAAMPLIADASVRATLYTKIEPLLKGLPADLATEATNTRGPSGRYVRIELPRRGTLSLAEVEVVSGGRNVARQGKATQSNVDHGGDAGRAIDGNKSGAYGDGGQTHTRENSRQPWWQVDLGADMPIESITIYNRTDGDLGKRLDGFTVKVLDANRKEVFVEQRVPAPAAKKTIDLGSGDSVAAVRHAAMNALTHVRGQEAKTFQSIAGFVKSDEDRAAAVRALQRIPRADWPSDQARPLVDALVAYVRKVPVAERTSVEALDALEFAHALAALLPATEAKSIRAELGELGVRVVRIGTLFERMAYDKEAIAVRAGKPVEFIFENTDLMPHNLVIVQPGAMEEIGLIAEDTAQQPDAARRHFVPASPKVLLSSVLLQPREMQKLSFTAPSRPGVYPYVCTYPGHWRRMYGALYVVEDLDAYLENPEAYLAANPLEIKDELLKDRRPRTEWKLEDLAGAVESLEHGRSYGNGKQLFQVANCAACHKLDGVGTEIGPDLAKLDPKYKSVDILKEMLDPSAIINEKYQTYILTLESGRSLTGLIIDDTIDGVKVIENPLTKAEPVVLKPREIAERERAAVSIMPKGLLDKLSREEILDLVAYVAARGNEKHPLFHGGHDHANHSSGAKAAAGAPEHKH
jgi:putative heme-binding domain-containing protein